MDAGKLRRVVLLLAVSLFVLFVAVVESKCASGKVTESDVTASLEDSFVEGDFVLELSNIGGYPIYYTLDGSVPSLESALYEGSIYMPASDEVQSCVVRAQVWEEDSQRWGEHLFTRTYFYANDLETIRERFSTYIVCLTSDPYNLYDYEYGILVEGKIRDEYAASEAYESDRLIMPANFTQTGRDWERDAYIEVLSLEGERLIAQDGGIRVFGNASRQSASKSFKLYARDEYGGASFDYPFFAENLSGDGLQVQDSYERLIVRNHGTDKRGTMMREELFQRLVAQIEGMDSKCVAPVSLWLNGSYYNFEWLQEVYDDLYLTENYGLLQPFDFYGQITIHADKVELDSDAGTKDQKAAEDYEEVRAFSEKDFTDDKVYEKFSEMVDLENLIRYCAIETYIANWDWPAKNVKAYRYYSKGGNYGEGRQDGRWRYLPYDMEAGFNIYDESPEDWVGISDVLEKSSLFSALMARRDLQEWFVDELRRCMEDYFTEEKVRSAVEELKSERDHELAANFAYKRSIDETYTLNMEDIDQNIEVIYDFLEKRPAQIRQEVWELFQIEME